MVGVYLGAFGGWGIVRHGSVGKTHPRLLPVQLAVKVEFVINLKTAKTLGLAFPLPLIGPRRRVIERVLASARVQLPPHPPASERRRDPGMTDTLVIAQPAEAELIHSPRDEL